MFNMLMGRKLMRHILKKDKFVLTVPLLTDAQGVKIGKTESNVIGLTDAPTDFYGKIMSLGDESIVPCFTLLTDKPVDEIETIKKKMAGGENPIVYKKQLAFELTKWLNNEENAQKANEEFEKVHQQGLSQSASALVVEVNIKDTVKVTDLLVHLHMVSSKSEAKRLLDEKAIEIDNIVAQYSVTNGAQVPGIKDGSLIKIGKKKFVKIKII